MRVPVTVKSVPEGRTSLKPKPPAPIVVEPEKSVEPVKFKVPSPVLVKSPAPAIAPA